MENKTVKHSLEQNNSSKRQKTDDELSLKINIGDSYTEPDFVKCLSESFCEKKKFSFENGAEIKCEPFTLCELPNFIQPDECIDQLKKDIEEMEVELKLSDLFQFKQSRDLSDCPYPSITLFKDLLYGKCLEWMKKITNIPLTDKVDVSVSCYTYSDHLLCHDDELEGRRIAYIYYLVPDWDVKYGGTLDLFSSVECEPTEIVTSLIPAWNKLIFFEVGPNSFHQVSEILAFKTRTSISGWFYGPPIKTAIVPLETMIFQSPTTVPVDVKNWINPSYLQPTDQIRIRESFEESSEIELMDFLQNEKYEEICKALLSNKIEWKQKGPACRRNIEELGDSSQLPPILQECQALFCSEPFLLVLSNLTGLRLHPVCGEDSPAIAEINSSIRRWGRGSYTLLHDQAFLDFPTLNAGLCLNCPDWEVEFGGYTSYVAKDENEELLRVDPKPNSLAIVYITEGTSNFVKYVNCRVNERPIPCFHDIFSVYREKE